MEQERAETMCWPWHWRQMTSQRWSERLPGTGRYQERIHSRYANLRLESSDTVSVLTATKAVLHDHTADSTIGLGGPPAIRDPVP
jgi:hypothetical protein